MMKILSPAKINLLLHVTGKRPDGFHELFTLMCCIGLYDTVSLFFDRKETTVTCLYPKVPQNEQNLAYRAARCFFKALGREASVRIVIDKQIPVAAGLGGGSSNAAAVLSGLNRYYHFPFTRNELMVMGFSLGADVPFFLFGKPAIATGIGEKLELYEGLAPFKVLLINPGFCVSTAEIYKNLNLGLTNYKNKNTHKSFKKKGFNVKKHLCNDLEAVTLEMYPGIQTLKKALLKVGANGTLMSGSGPTVFGLFSDRDRAQKAYASLSKKDQWQLYLVDMIVKENAEYQFDSPFRGI